MLRQRRLFFLLLALLLSLAACRAADSQPEEPEAQEMTTLIYAVLSEDGVDQRMIDQFNARHKKRGVRIEVRYYLNEDGWDGKSRLLTEMASGNVPDIIELGDGPSRLPYRQLARGGYLEDLWPYINNDSHLNNGQIWEAPFHAAEVDGGLYTIFTDVGINTLIGRESVVGTGYSWSMEELMDAFSRMPEESTVLEYYRTKNEMFYYMFCMSLDSYVDWDTGETSFDCEAFRTALDFVNSFPDDFPSLRFEGGWAKAQEEVGDRVRHGEQMLSVQDIRSVLQIEALNRVYARGEQLSFIGYPMEDGSAGSVFTIQGRKLAMSSTCQDKDAAWDFLQQALIKKYSVRSAVRAVYFPINRSSFDRVMEAVVRPPSYAPGGGYSFFNGTVEVAIRRVKRDVVTRFEDYCEHIDKIDLYDTALYDIVLESCGPYFAGDKTLDETIETIERRVSLYVNEQL